MPKTRGQLVLPCVAENGSYPGGRKRPSEIRQMDGPFPSLLYLMVDGNPRYVVPTFRTRFLIGSTHTPPDLGRRGC